jgi:hypothetical protein
MAGLGNYTLSPQLDGTVFAYHPKKKLRGSYDNENDFLYSLQKYDWTLFYSAISDAIQAASRLQRSNHYTRNATGAHMAISAMLNNFSIIHQANPVNQGKAAKYMIDKFPLLCGYKNTTDNPVILQALQVISDYYSRYLAKYETFENSFLTA